MRDYDTTRSWSKKDTKRWCRGKVGVEHQPECLPYRDLYPTRPGSRVHERWWLLVCKVCGRRLAHYYGVPESPPAWVPK